ncbi:MAG: hypothetical protein ERJ67_10530 [Aphanocapsa feldmannii 277cV]|uniref:Nuclease n=2 Tax=Aphanocapsa feldmannii TaxID=192050 RepID=A0A524RL32_9CHRO|nr:MAG: hypothetical protein ERJ69_06240 [Aphanocapsa feldmannii 288cV]TGG90580.1 MAG: hypothetical protein ERJ67_10530 [Aphanocapsa feldmannii 277cV]TGH27551.1 MAG: hypothetical protein ERJ68_01000 [Aphanocapsa feldmannii 277cI]
MALLLCLGLLMVPALPANGAEVLQVRSSTLLQIGDRNRSYSVRLGCRRDSDPDPDAALAWLRGQLPRGTRVNLLPLDNDQGTLVARVRRLDDGLDLSVGLAQAGLIEWDDACGAPPCP